MALPPNMVTPGLDLDDTEGLPEVEIPIDAPEEFEGGAEVIDDGMGGAIVQALMMADEMPQEELIPFDANLAEFLDDAILGSLSSDLRGSYKDDLDSRSEWEDTSFSSCGLFSSYTDGSGYGLSREEHLSRCLL